MLGKLFGWLGDLLAPLGDALAQSMINATLVRRLGTVEEIAAAVAFIASDEAGFITGEVLVVDSRAERPGGYQARLQVTVLLSPSEDSAQPYRVLRWQE